MTEITFMNYNLLVEEIQTPNIIGEIIGNNGVEATLEWVKYPQQKNHTHYYKVVGASWVGQEGSPIRVNETYPTHVKVWSADHTKLNMIKLPTSILNTIIKEEVDDCGNIHRSILTKGGAE